MLSYYAIIAIYVFAMVSSLAVLLMSIYVRKAPKSLWCSYTVLAVFIFTTGYYFEITSLSEMSAIVATKLQYLGACYIAPFLLLFIMEYCGKQISKLLIAAIMVLPTVTLVLVQMWPMNTLYYQEIVFVTDVVVPYLYVTGAPFYYVFYLYTHLLTVAAAAIAFKFYRKSTTSIRKQALTLVIGILITLTGNIINIFKLTSWELDLTPIALSLTCILLGYSIFQQGLYRIVPIAREQIVESMSDGFILVDMEGRFIDANSAAKGLLPQLNNTIVGTPLDELEELAWLSTVPLQSEFWVEDQVSKERKYHRISKTNIRFQQQEICSCFMIFDITDTKQLLNKVSDLAERDSLTGLVHRGAFYEKGWRLLKNTGSACLLMIDLDYFKNINDQYGHLKGDEVLKETSLMLSKCVRNTDLLARYGGEEFCALLPGLGIKDALELAERIRRRMENYSFQSAQGNFNVTLSIGVAMYDSAKHVSFEELVADADMALYAAKSAGRNTVATGEPSRESSEKILSVTRT